LIRHDDASARLDIVHRPKQTLTPRRIGQERCRFVSFRHDDLDELVREGCLHPLDKGGD
jgi:hypothetical protein